MAIETIIAIGLLAVAIMVVLIAADAHPWTTMIGGGILIIAGIVLATGSIAPAIVWAALLGIGLCICVGTDRIIDDDDSQEKEK